MTSTVASTNLHRLTIVPIMSATRAPGTPVVGPGPPPIGHPGNYTPAMRQAASAPPAPPASSQAASQRAANAAIAQSQATLTNRLNQAATNLITSSMLRRAPLPTPIIPHPRVGGVDSLGSWTGRGARGQGKDPRGPNCRRIFNSPDPLKAYSTIPWFQLRRPAKLVF